MSRYSIDYNLRITLPYIIFCIVVAELLVIPVYSRNNNDTVFAKHTKDFIVNGKGDNPAWNKTAWQQFIKIDSGGVDYKSKSKILYSENGLYLLFSGEDNLITTKDYKDDEQIYEGDVFEFFLRPDTAKPMYFEYEINAKQKQLTLTLSGSKKNIAWSPWHYEYKHNPQIVRKVNVVKEPGDKNNKIMSWSAEIFFPYEMFALLPGVPPKSGSQWKGNFCRIDYDSGKMIQWSWSKKIVKDFHEVQHFGTIIFE